MWVLVVMQNDANSVVHWINGEESLNGPIRLIVTRCRRWLTEGWNISVVYVNREQNCVADALAKMACRTELQWATFESPLPEARMAVESDRLYWAGYGLVFPRGPPPLDQKKKMYVSMCTTAFYV